MNKTIILANGKFPSNKKVINILKSADKIICCDGAAKKLIDFGLNPTIIIGDMDSLSSEIKKKYSNIIIKDPDQNTNDLTKAVNWCVKNKINNIVIIGATGNREDHTIANISLAGQYVKSLNLKIITDYGEFIPITKTTEFKSFAGQQISIFTLTPNVKIQSEGLKYPLNNIKLSRWWMGTLNESLTDRFLLKFNNNGIFIVYLNY